MNMNMNININKYMFNININIRTDEGKSGSCRFSGGSRHAGGTSYGSYTATATAAATAHPAVATHLADSGDARALDALLLELGLDGRRVAEVEPEVVVDALDGLLFSWDPVDGVNVDGAEGYTCEARVTCA